MDELLQYQKNYNPYGKPVNYPKGCTGVEGCQPFGFNKIRPNPGGLKFYYLYYPFQTQGGKLLSHPGRGWYRYHHTGVYN